MLAQKSNKLSGCVSHVFLRCFVSNRFGHAHFQKAAGPAAEGELTRSPTQTRGTRQKDFMQKDQSGLLSVQEVCNLHCGLLNNH